MILDGKKVRDELLDKLKKEISDNNYDISFAIVLIGNNKESLVYVNNKLKYAEKVGINAVLIHKEEASEEEIINIIEDLNKDPKISGIILQSPLPEGLNIENCIKHIDPNKDIDGFTKESVYNYTFNHDGLYPCTPLGIINLLKYYDIPLKGAKVAILGTGKLVGKPLIPMMLNEGATVICLNHHTKDISEYTKTSDIIVTATGVAHLLKEDMVKEGAVVVDAGVSVIDGKVDGDADYDNLKEKCSYITPNPGGVGPMTIATILTNVVKAYKKGGGKNG